MKVMKLTTKNILYVVAILLLTNVTACKKLASFDYPDEVGTAYEVLKNDGNFSTFFSAATRAGLDDLLKGGQAYTIYAPNNTAFTAAGYTAAVIQNMTTENLASLVKNHIVEGATDVNALEGSEEQTALSGMKVVVEKKGGLYYVNGGDILNPSQAIANGFLHVSSTLLVSKPTLLDAIKTYTNSGNAQLTFLAAAITRASSSGTDFTGMLSGTTPYTLLAPNNGAFIDGGFASVAAINSANPETLANILKYHLIAGTKFTTAFDSVPVTAYDGSPIYFDIAPRKVTATTIPATNFTYWYANGISFGNAVPANLLADNGVMHTVSRLLPAPDVVSTLDYIEADTTLSMFRALIAKASEGDSVYNFEEMLSSPTQSYTLFVVNNQGLRNEGYANEEAINNADATLLARMLRFHVISKRINNINIADGETVNTFYSSNASTAISFLKTGGFSVKGPSNASPITVIKGNIVTTNGLVNIIGSALMP